MSREHPMQEIERMANIKKSKQDPSNSREGLLFLANLALVGRRYEHMFQYMKRLVGIVAPSKPLSDNERHHFSTACFSLVKGQRDSYRIVSQAARDSAPTDQRRADAALQYLQLIASEIAGFCSDVVGVIDMCFFGCRTSAETVENRVFYMKMKADFQCYLADVKMGEDREIFIRDAFRTYLLAKKEAENLRPTNATRLELFLSVAQFFTDMHGAPSYGYKVAKEAFDMATLQIEIFGDPVTADTTEALRRLQSHLDSWKIYQNT